MAQRSVPLVITIPPGTPISAPASFGLQFPSADVERIDVRIPPGPNGTVGFNINNGGGSYIPDTNGSWIVGNDDSYQWPLDDAPNNGNWTVVAYNTDVLPHTIYLYFWVNNLVIVNTPSSSGMLGL